MGNLLGSWRYKEPSTVEECDSTWDTDSESEDQQCEEEESIPVLISATGPQKRSDPPASSQQYAGPQEPVTKVKRSFYAARDLYKYRHSYPSFREPRQPKEFRNLRFYLNKIPLVPDGIYVDEILTQWRGDYEKLEHNHTYIQWLFPLREQGLNFYAQELTQDEIKEFQSSRDARRRFLQAYALMLDFYGIQLLDKSGRVARGPNWQDRFQHLNESQHNYLRITRILKSLGELGFEALKLPLVRLLLEEALVSGTLPNMRHSALEYFVYTLRDRAQRRALLRFAQRHYLPPEDFVWGPPRRRRVSGARARPAKESHPKSPASLHSEKGGATGDCAEEGNRRVVVDRYREEEHSGRGDGKMVTFQQSSSARPLMDVWREAKSTGDRLGYGDTLPLKAPGDLRC